MQLTKRNITGKHSFHVFDQNGSQVITECSAEEYLGLAKPDAKPLTKFPYQLKNNQHQYQIDGIWCPWVMSLENYKFDTVDGWLKDGDYFDNGASYRARVNGKEGNVAKENIVNDVISAQGLTDVAKRQDVIQYTSK